ncbi:MAG: urate hydroxylase PuuD [Gammaproteobacteria bacterium]
MNPLRSIPGTIISGVVLAVIFAVVYKTGQGSHLSWTVWFHAVVGVIWIGLLYYFNFVQVPAMAAAKADGTAAGISKHVAPRALLWFRWAALLTWLSGAAILFKLGIFADAFMLKGGAAVIGVGAWLGTIMLFNVWVLIWPNQKKVLGLVEADDAAKAKAGNIALLASRTNTLLSIPMLLSMTASTFHNTGLPL